MVIGVVLAGIVSGLCTAMVSAVVGHPFETTVLIYMTAGLIGATVFCATAMRLQDDVL